ncbi:MAG: isocitrate lyase/PEP mutase family protein [Candidatus Electrothrix scaldis]|nr:MAG: isocitrate lyase/PEP mutase family protein [Candidatus Electrothrix sp. GW3-3]
MSKKSMHQEIAERNIFPFIGVYDVFSASIAAKFYDALFISGFSFAASHYGLPDIGFIAWSDIVEFVRRVRTILPHHHILVDIDDGYTDVEVACHVVSQLESIRASGIIIEDQKRPRRCGHFDGKQLIELDEFIHKLKSILAVRRNMFVIARTDAIDFDDIMRRAEAFVEAGADAVLVDAIQDIELLRTLKSCISRPLVFNQIAGGKSPICNLQELQDVGVSIVIYSTPALFAAQESIGNMMISLRENNGLLVPEKRKVDVQSCTAVLNENLARRDTLRD